MAKFVRMLIVVMCLAACTLAQDQREALGPKDEPGLRNKPNPLAELMQSVHSQLRPELIGQHPRVYATNTELIALRERAKTSHKELWQGVLKNLRAMQGDPPPPPAQARRAQNDVAIAIAEASLAYAIERDPRYLAAAKKYMDAAVSYDVWGYSFNKPNVDLAAGHLLYGLGMGYDLLYNDLTPAERERYRNKLARQAQLLADYYKPKPGRSYSYSQNHVFIPIAGLAVAAYAVYDEVPNAPQWAALSRAIYDRVLATYSVDGYYYEGFEYWVFSTPWIIHYLDAQKHATGEDLFDHPGLRNMHYYIAHVVLPGGHDMFDFGDVFEGPLTRAKQGDDYERSHPDDHLAVNYNLLYDLAGRFKDAKIQGVADYMKSLGAVNAEDFWSLIWYDPGIPATPIKEFPNWHHFKDHDVVFWRSDWTPQATAIAFKCGPPEGHHTAALLKKSPDWHLSAGHSHPDANSFILFSKGSYLTGDSGYAGVPMTQQHNTLLIDGKGQGNEGVGHDPWDGYDYDRLDKIRIMDVQATATTLKVIGDAANAYGPQFALTKFERQLSFDGKAVSVQDDVRADKPHIYTVLLHADQSIAKEGKSIVLHDGSGSLMVNVLAPPDYTTDIQLNKVTAPGRPGSVDKGEVQVRGEKLGISNRNASNDAEFKIELQPGNTAKSAAETASLPKIFLLDAKLLADRKAKAASSNRPTTLVQAVRKEADKALSIGPFSVTQKEKVPPSGDKHDYMTQAPYWWPDPKKPDGLPYIRRDGERNPEAKANSDEDRMNKTVRAAHALALAWYFNGEAKYAERAAMLLRVFFLDPATRMNPNLNFGQGIPGKYPGGKSGIIETHTLPAAVDAVGLLAGSPSWTAADQKGMVDWFAEYLKWLRESKLGREEADSKNNHGTWYDVQVADFALFIGERDLATSVIRASKEKRIAAQVEPDGRQPLELARTKAFSYSCFNLNAMMSLATLADVVGEDLWNFQTKDGRSIRRALDFLVPYATGQKKWEYPQITGFNAAELAPALLTGVSQYKDGAYLKAAEETNASNNVTLLLLRARAQEGPGQQK